MTSITNDFVTDRVRCWYYTEQNAMASIGRGYANFVVSDKRNVRTENGDLALVVAKHGDKYLAHVSQVTRANLENKIEKHAETWGESWLTNAGGENSRLTVHAVRHLTRIHDITEHVDEHQIGFNQSGVSMNARFDLVAHLIFLG